MEEKQNIAYYAIIPSTVLYKDDLKPNQKLLYAIITSLSNKEGYCYATNRYLAEKLKVKSNTVSGWITDLKRKGFIKVELIRNEKKQVIQRRIYLNDVPYAFYKVDPSNIKMAEGIPFKSKENNIIKIDINLIMNNENIQKSFWKVYMQIRYYYLTFVPTGQKLLYNKETCSPLATKLTSEQIAQKL